MRRLIGVLTFVAALLLALGPVASAQAAPFCAAGQAPQFAFGLAALKSQLGATMGEPLECEHANSANGDTLQRTTTGLAYYRKATNTPSFTDGFRHWALTAGGLVTWTGTSVDPPSIPTSNGISPSRLPVPEAARDSHIYPLIDPPANDSSAFCLPENPSCGRDPWWIEWNEVQLSDFVQYRFLEPGLVTERRYDEAVRLLWQWPEGKFLLDQAAGHAVPIVTAPASSLRGAFAAFSPERNFIAVNRQFTETSTWMVADLMAHELKHAADDRAGVRAAETYPDCIAREQVAYQVEARFLNYLAARFNGLPSPQQVSSTLSTEDFQLYTNLRGLATSPNVDAQAQEDYRRGCTGLPGSPTGGGGTMSSPELASVGY